MLQCLGMRLGGWLEQGISATGRYSADGYNGVVGFNDRDREYQMNQLYLYLERKVDTGGCGADWGGRVDLLYGTDARYTQAAGLEDRWQQSERFYQVSAPQFYLDIGLNDWTVRMGHFYTILGYEVVPAPDNFFYSHSYSMMYGEPFTHTGLLLMRKLGDQLTISGGVTRGIDQFEDTDGLDTVDFLGGVTWTSEEERLSLAFAITAGELGPGNSTWIYSTVAKLKLSERLEYVLQHDFGQSVGATKAEWYSLLQNLVYRINPCWAFGLRYEWFGDPDGFCVSGNGDGDPWTVYDNPHTGPYQGDFQEVSLGLNWKPRANLTFRPELRWDWFAGSTEAGSERPFAGNRNSQFMAACDMIVTW